MRASLILEGALDIIRRDKKGFGVMIFPDSIFKYTSNMVKEHGETCRRSGGWNNRLYC
jgi:hypothetical protein